MRKHSVRRRLAGMLMDGMMIKHPQKRKLRRAEMHVAMLVSTYTQQHHLSARQQADSHEPPLR